MGFTAEVSNDGNDAFEMVKRRWKKNREMFQLIIMDYAMPFCNGVQATIKIRKFFDKKAPKDARQPFICCLTSYNDLSFKTDAINAGMDGFMTKPIAEAGVRRLLTKSGLI